MKRYVKEFFHRGLLFGGFGPIVAGVVYLILSYAISDFSLTGWEVFVAILSTYVLAFVQAGGSVFNQIESWSLPKSLLCHFSLLYVAYTLCYLVNTWIPFQPMVILVFTLIFVVAYFVIWITVFLCVKIASQRMTKRLL